MILFNSLTGRKETFEPLVAGQVRMYVCGLTVSDDAHLGHGRAAVFFDLLRRFFRYRGLRVLYVRNITDVDDKIIARSREAGTAPEALAERYIARHAEDLERLRVPRADIEPRASEHIPRMIAFVEELLRKGAAYARGGDVFFKLETFSDFGAMARLAGREPERADFLLWKAAAAGEPAWDSPWGKGRPGWHIECSAMAREFLGATFDIHGGGADLTHPHHDAEIAQSRSLSGHPPARFFVHNALVHLSGEKMSKSVGNFFTLREIFARHDPAVVRYYFFRTHYREPITFSEPALDEARHAVERRDAFLRASSEIVEPPPAIDALSADALERAVHEARPRIIAALEDDFDIPTALDVIESLVAAGEEHLRSGSPDPRLLGKVEELLEEMDELFDLSLEGKRIEGRHGELVEELLKVRHRLAHSPDAAGRDAARLIEEAMGRVGIDIIDTPWRTRWRWEP